MRRLWDAVILVIIGIVAVHSLAAMLRPYAWEIVLGVLVILFIERVVKHYQNW